MITDKRHIFFVDDEPAVRKSVAKTLKWLGCKVICFANAADCLSQLRTRGCDLLITDVKMPGMDGIKLVKRAKSIAPWLPILVITGYGDIPMAVGAVKAGAVDFIEKPLQRDSFLQAVQAALKQTTLKNFLTGKTLTKKELTVLRLLLQGRSNREIARILHRSVRTIEDHRSNIMHKLDVDNMVDLVKRVAGMDLAETSP
ncbi:MAG: response regulator transcription factor [Planctomycetota bacterium]|nr:MAG: response regulator transcription factor [Planctomycetota bacterium]